MQANAKTYVKGDFAAGMAQGAARWLGGRHGVYGEGGSRQVPPPRLRMASQLPAGSEDASRFIFRPDPSLYDGRYANVGWLQELPKQVTNLSWDNAAMMSMATMVTLGVEENDADRDRVQRPQGALRRC